MWEDRLQQMPSILQLLVIFYEPLPFVFFATFPPQNKGIAILKKAQHSQYKPRKVNPTEHTAFIDLPEKEHLPTIHWHRTQAKRAWRTVLSRCRAVQLCWKWDTEAGVGLRGSPWSLEPPSTSQASTPFHPRRKVGNPSTSSPHFSFFPSSIYRVLSAISRLDFPAATLFYTSYE